MRTAAATTWADICDELVEIEHQLWRAALPVNYQPLQRDLATFHSLPLELSAAERVDLFARRQALRLQAAQMSAAQQSAAHGRPDAWLLVYIVDLEGARCYMP